METNEWKEQRESRRAAMRDHLERHRQSGMSVKAYCAANGLKAWQFWYYRKLNQPPAASGFEELRGSGCGSLSVEVGGCRLCLTRPFDAELLRQVVAVLKAS